MFHKSHFWLYLLNLSESLAHCDPASRESLQKLTEELESLEAIFRPALDPVDELEKFSVLSLCGNIKRILGDTPADHSAGKARTGGV